MNSFNETTRYRPLKAQPTSQSQLQSQPSIVAPLHRVEPSLLFEAQVTCQLNEEQWLLDHTNQADRAFSCLLKPQVGDQILYARSGDSCHIIAVLTRASESNDKLNDLSLPKYQPILLKAESIDLVGKQKLTLSSFADIEINALIGTIKCNARHLFQTIQQSVIQISKQFISRSEHQDISASKLLKSHARHQIISAEKEMKIDAERINMG